MDDMYVLQEPAIEAKPTIHQFVPINHNYNKDNKPWNYLTLKDLHGNSSAAHRTDNKTYSAKMSNRLTVRDKFKNLNILKRLII